ncbi:MAG TPA: crotonase/enoyl-CoA hydratase family protein [Limnobacter sp.]|nr:crotonase/enoyl-CoA hydratase family protein [Limnobacter sp.]
MDRISLQFNADNTVATVALNRPDKHNGVDWLMLKQMSKVQQQLAKHASLRAVVLKGEGASFCAGLDFKSVLADPKTAAVMYANLWLPMRNIFQRWSTGWRDLGVPVIAQIHGNCFGAGIQLALGADIRVCTPDAKLSILEAKWGLVPDMGGGALLRELVPVDVAKELTMTGRTLSGEQAKQLGLVSHVVVDPQVKVNALIQEILGRSPDSVAASKFMIQNIWGIDQSAHLTQERRWQRRLLGFKNQRISVQKNSKSPELPFAKRQIR